MLRLQVVVMNDINALFSSPVISDVLALLLLNHERQYYQAEIVKETNYAQIQVQRALERLCLSELILKTKQGRMVYYQANKNHVGFVDLKNLFMKTVGFVDTLRKALLTFGDDIQIAFIYGSIASGKETLESDIDLLLITGLSLRKLTSKIGPISRQLKRELNISCFTINEFTQKDIEQDHFIKSVLDKPKTFVIGDENELEKLLK